VKFVIQGRWKLPQGQARGQERRAGRTAEAGQHIFALLDVLLLKKVKIKRNIELDLSGRG